MLKGGGSRVLRLAVWISAVALVGSLSGAQTDGMGPLRVPSSVSRGPIGVLQEAARPHGYGPYPATVIPVPSLIPSPTATPTPTPSPTPPPPPPSPPPPAPVYAAAPTQPPAPPPAAVREYADPDAAAAVLALTNALRIQHGLPPLAANAALAAVAGGYSQTMAVNDWFSHEGPDGSKLGTRAEAAGYTGWTYLAENLYKGYYLDSPESIVQAWVDSPGHLENMLSPRVTEIGVGCYVRGEYRWCSQEFGSRS